MSITSQIRYVCALDSTATDGSGKTGLAFGDITAKYLVMGGTLTSLTTETITTLGTYQAPSDAAHIRIKELAGADPTKGVYEVHFHDTQLAASGKKLWLFLSATGAAFQPLEVDLVPYMFGDGQSAADDKDFVDTGYDPATHKVAGVVLVDTTTTNTDMRGTNSALLASSYTAPDNADIVAIKAKTDNLPAAPAAVGSQMTLADGAITDAKITMPAETAGIPTTALAMLRRVWEWWTRKRTRDRSTGTVNLYGANDTTVLETQTQSTSGTTDTISKGA